MGCCPSPYLFRRRLIQNAVALLIAETWPRCHGRNTTVLKVEDMASGYRPFITSLGWQAAASSGWNTQGGCFYTPPGVPCSTALNHSLAEGGRDRRRHCARGDRQTSRTDTSACRLMREYYTPELVRLVTAYASADLHAFSYDELDPDSFAVKNGSVEAP